MTTSRVTAFKVSMEDRAGILADMLSRFKEEKVDLAGMWGWTDKNTAGFIIVGKDPVTVRKALKKIGWKAEETQGFFVEEHDRIGSLSSVAGAVAEAGINLRATQAIGIGGKVGCYLWCNQEDLQKTARILNA